MAYSTLSLEKRLAKNDFKLYLSSEKNKHALWTNDYGDILEKYLNLVHGIRVVPEFSKRLKEAHNQYHSSRKFDISFNVVDSIVASCDMWLFYLASNEDYDLLVCQEIFSMARIHTSVISGRNIQEVQGVKLRKPVPYSRVTIVKENGSFQLIK